MVSRTACITLPSNAGDSCLTEAIFKLVVVTIDYLRVIQYHEVRDDFTQHDAVFKQALLAGWFVKI